MGARYAAQARNDYALHAGNYHTNTFTMEFVQIDLVGMNFLRKSSVANYPADFHYSSSK